MGRDCAGVSVQVKSLDRYVEDAVRTRAAALQTSDALMEVVLERIARRSNPELYEKLDVIRQEISAIEERRFELEEARYLRGEFGGEEGAKRYSQFADSLHERLERLREAAGHVSLALTSRPAGRKEELPRMVERADSLEERRELLRLFVDRAEVQPGRVGARFDGDSRVAIIWAEAGAPAIS
jgi:site-specific DNA recombinase